MNEVDKLHLLDLAKDAIKTKFTDEELDFSDVEHLDSEKGVFVKLVKQQNLRGAMGFVHSDKPLYKTVAEAARKAAFEDSRFTPVRDDELMNLRVEISILNEPEELTGDPEDFPDQIDEEKHGVMIEGAGRALLLPEEAMKNRYTPVQFLNALAQKAGLGFNAWRDTTTNTVYKFTAETFSD